MEARAWFDGLGSLCKQALRYLHRIFWDCLWSFRGRFHFAYVLTLFLWNVKRFFIFEQVGDFRIFNYSIRSHNMRITPIDSVVLVIEELEYFDCNLNLMMSFLSGLCFSCRWN